MKPNVGILLETELIAGGGHHEEMNLLQDLINELKPKYELKIISYKSHSQNLFGLEMITVKKSNILNLIFLLLKSSLLGIFFLRYFDLNSKFEKNLKFHKLDYVFFLSPSWRAALLRDINFSFTIWDTCHKQHPEFEEVRRNFSISIRDYFYSMILPWANTILVDSKKSLKNIITYYSVDRSKIIVLPFRPSSLIAEMDPRKNTKTMHSEKKYILYPAQFWQHKNHRNLIEGFKLAQASLPDLELIFTGSDKGQMYHLKSLVKKLGLENKVKFLGFVENEKLLELYKNSFIVIFPSFFGVTNLIPLEAWQFKIPLACSEIFKSQVKDAAILFNPYDPSSISNAIFNASQEDIRQVIIGKGSKLLLENDSIRSKAIIRIGKNLNRCFSKLNIYNTHNEF